jgi:hypothetical protein
MRSLPANAAVGYFDLLRRNQAGRSGVPLDTDELSTFTLEFINDCSLGGDIDRAIAIKDFLRCPASDSAQTHIDHFSTPGNYFKARPDSKTGLARETAL